MESGLSMPEEVVTSTSGTETSAITVLDESPEGHENKSDLKTFLNSQKVKVFFLN
jgi:hypothetical protein